MSEQLLNAFIGKAQQVAELMLNYSLSDLTPKQRTVFDMLISSGWSANGAYKEVTSR